ncbi:hypothetical protein [Sphingobium lignivorans]|uniref:Uncharacterized protein n=1 Tax=Sphingobium lignivorans TaxID=2735886 RepID=A0ABR6NJD1_9SPHN|nr:hypothetical protein [Sphingobium lignivorans]MBB5987393.1 hypothetical protein [Sphingobium lignivorans]
MSARASLLTGATLFDLDPSEIETADRIGFLHVDKAAALGRLMAVDGQRDPIKVTKNRKGAARPWRLVTGMHRTHGAELEGIRVWAIEVSGKPEDLADLEASENLHRRPLAPIERAKFVHALAMAAQERLAREHGNLKQQQLAIKARWQRVKGGELRAEQALQEESDDTADKMSAVYGWQDSAADALALDKRTIRRALELFHLVVEPFPDLIEPLARHPVVGENGAQLKILADIRNEDQRRKVIEALLADDGLNAEDARINVGVSSPAGPAPQPHQKHVNAVVGNLDRLSASQQKRFLGEFVSALKTIEIKRQLRDILNEELGE